jgi:hypothetical protein
MMTAGSRLSWFLVIALIPLSDVVFAQAPPDAVFAPAAPQQRSQRVDPLTASIRGRITTADTGAPIRGAQVRLSMDGRFSRLVTTDGEGRYELRTLPAGTYKLTVSRTGFITLEYGQRRPFESSSAITIGEGQSATGNVALIRGGAIFGRILDQFGDPSVGTRVQVMRIRTEEGRRRLLNVGPGDSTDDMGAFRLYGLPPGDYYVAASTGLIDAVKRDPPVYYPGTMNMAEAQPITLGAGVEASADFQIVSNVRTARVSGVVLNSSGVPVQAMVNLVSDTGPTGPGQQMLHSDGAPDGSFFIDGVPPGSYVLTAMIMSQQALGAAAAISGSFGVPSEAARERMLSQTPETASMAVVVTEEGLSGITVAARRPGRLSGRFVADTGIVTPLPSNLRVNLRSPGPGGMSMTLGGQDKTEFQVGGMSGPARVEVQGLPEGWAVKAITYDGEDVTDRSFDLSSTGSLRVVLTNRLTTLNGSIQSNSELKDHTVVVFSEDATKWGFPSRFVRAVRADTNGRFRIQGLPPERYLAVALNYLEDGEEQDRQLLERLRNRATSVTLGDGDQRSVQLEVMSR